MVNEQAVHILLECILVTFHFVWWGVCMAGGMCGKGAYMHGKGGMHGGCMVGSMHSRGACMAGGMHDRGHAWQGVHGRGGVHGTYYKIWSMSGQYAFYWNAEGGMCGGVAGGMHGRGVCMAEGHAQQGSMHGRGGKWKGMCMTDTMRYGQ